jgi:hypothetical protein
MAVEQPPIPTEKREPAWRRACLAYHEWRVAGATDHEAREAAVAAVQTVLPLPWQEASIEAANAVAYGPVIIPSGSGGAPRTQKNGVQPSGTT